jgi:hypothetical protein
MKEKETLFDLTSALLRRDVDGNGLEIIRNLIKEYREDSNLLIMQDDCWQRLDRNNLLMVFEEACEELGIKWRYDNNLPRE